jgi:hypothetical protein
VPGGAARSREVQGGARMGSEEQGGAGRCSEEQGGAGRVQRWGIGSREGSGEGAGRLQRGRSKRTESDAIGCFLSMPTHLPF